MGNPGSGFISPSALSDSTNAGVSPTIDTSAASATTHVNPSFGDRLGSVASSYLSEHAPTANGLFNQVFGSGNQGRIPIQEGTGPPIVGIPESNVQAPQVHGSGVLKALMQAFI